MNRFPVLARIIGFLIVLGSALAIAGLTTLFVLLIVSPENVLIDFPLHEILDGFTYRALLFSAYALLFLPIVVVLMLGATFLNLKNAFSIRSFLVLMALWSSAIVVAGVTGFSAAPSIKLAVDRLAEERERIITKTFAVEDFDRVRMTDSGRLVLAQSDDLSVTVEAHARRMPDVTAMVENGTLVLQRGPYEGRCLFFCPTRSVTITVRAPSLAGIEAGGISHTDIAAYTGESLAFIIRDNAFVTADVALQELTVEGGGRAHLTLSGSAERATMTFGDSVSLDGRSFRVESAQLTTRDFSSVVLDVIDRLTGHAADHSRILFLRRPEILEITTSEEGRVGMEGEERG